MEGEITVNQGKSEIVEFCGEMFACYAIRTRVITKDDTIEDIVEKYVKPNVRGGDIVFFSEKMTACTEGRAYPIEDIKAGRLARFLSRFVRKTSRGIGLSIPETMQCAIDECGRGRILLAAAAGMAGKIFGIKGLFYRVAGFRAASVDGPCPYTLPPYNKYVVLSPRDPDKTAREVSRMLGGNTVLIIDANDYGCAVLGSSAGQCAYQKYEWLLRQNPLGQSTQCTPIGILRPLK